MWVSIGLSYLLLWFPVLALLVLFGLLVARRSYRELPYFFIYILSALLVGAARYATFPSKQSYFYVYWISELLGVVFVSLALYEVFLRRLFTQFHKIRIYRKLFAAVALAITALTILTALQAPDKGKAFEMASRAYDFARTAVLVFMLLLMSIMGREWTRYNLGIALGFAVQAAAALFNAAVQARMHYQPTFLDTVEGVSLDISLVIWIVTFLKPERPAALTGDEMNPELLREARGWESMLKAWLRPGKAKQKRAGRQD